MDRTEDYGTPKWERTLTCYLVWHQRHGLSLDETLAQAAEHRPEYPQEHLRALWPLALQACRNVELVNGCGDDVRLCDVPGIVLRPSSR